MNHFWKSANSVDEFLKRAANKSSDEFDEMSKKFEEKFRGFGELLNRNTLSEMARSFDNIGVPRVNVKNVTSGTEYEVEAPGFEKEDFSVEAVNGVLSIKAEKQSEADECDKAYVRREFSSVSFTRSIPLPPGISTEGISAKYENGVLRITIPVAAKQEISLIKVL